jgi:hypothetical protein
VATREEIIQDVARTLFMCAWADGVESGEIKGNKPGGGGDWEDVAPLSWLFCAECDGRTYLGDVGLDERRCPTCNGKGILYMQDPDAEREARRIVDAFDERARDASSECAPPAGFTGAHGKLHPIEYAATLHTYYSGGERFAHCLAMQALGSGVGLSDDLPPGVSLPGWIKASVASSDFGAWSLNPERYPAPEKQDSSKPEA